jgi:hypothetical protein
MAKTVWARKMKTHIGVFRLSTEYPPRATPHWQLAAKSTGDGIDGLWTEPHHGHDGWMAIGYLIPLEDDDA